MRKKFDKSKIDANLAIAKTHLLLLLLLLLGCILRLLLCSARSRRLLIWRHTRH